MGKQSNSNDSGKTGKAKGLGFGLGLAGGVLAVGVGLTMWLQPAGDANASEITVYKSPTCGCCNKWVDHLRDAGFRVTTKDMRDVTPVKEANGVRSQWRSCHTALVGGYVVEGHVPAADIKRLLEEKPAVNGLAVPGMPMGSPGMEGAYKDPYDVLAFDKSGAAKVFARY